METQTERDLALYGPRTAKAPGSTAWCWQTIHLMQSRWRQKTLDEAGFHALVEELRSYDAWNVVPPEQPYGSLEALLEAEIGYGELEARRQLVAQAQPKRGRPGKCADSAHLTLGDRAQQNGVGRDKQRKLDYLAGHAPALLVAVQDGTMSTHAAYQQARGLHKESPLTTLHRIWRQVDPDDRLRFLVEMLTPNERRVLQLGFEDQEGTG